MSSRILFVEDDAIFRDTYVDVLRRDGYDVAGAATAEEARGLLAGSQDWELVVTDERLRGGDGPAMGSDVAREVALLVPHAKTIIITAWPTDASVTAGFEAGAWDYLVKGDGFEPMLRIKVRNALDAVRSARLARLPETALEAELQQWWQVARTETDRHRKGNALEQTLVCLFRSISGLSEVDVRRRNRVEEIDLVVANNSPEPYWQKLGAYLLVECKNWQEAVGPEELSRLADRLLARPGIAKVGFLVSTRGFTDPAREKLRSLMERGIWIVPVDGEQLDRLVRTHEREPTLRKLLHAAVVP